MLELTRTVHINCRPDDVLELVMDIERYASVDAKINPVLWSRREGNTVEFACRPRLAGLRQPTVVQRIELTPGQRVDISLAPKPRNRLAHAMAEFEASFDCAANDGGTDVTRSLRFRFRPVGRLLEPWLRRRLPREVDDELALARAYLERAHR